MLVPRQSTRDRPTALDARPCPPFACRCLLRGVVLSDAASQGDELPEGFREFLFDYLEESADCRREGRGDSSPEFPPHDLARRPSLSASSDGIWSDGRSSEGRPEGSSVLGAAGKAVIRSVAQKAGAILSPRSGASSASVCSEVELDVHFCDDQPVQLGQSIWDAALLTGCRHISRADSMLIVLLVLLNIAAQSIFLGIVYYIFMEEKFTERFHAHMLEWRTHVGHHIQHYDPYTFSSLTERICQPDKHTPELSSYISKQVETMHTFLDKGNVFFNGQNLLSVAILCWTLTIVRELRPVSLSAGFAKSVRNPKSRALCPLVLFVPAPISARQYPSSAFPLSL